MCVEVEVDESQTIEEGSVCRTLWAPGLEVLVGGESWGGGREGERGGGGGREGERGGERRWGRSVEGRMI